MTYGIFDYKAMPCVQCHSSVTYEPAMWPCPAFCLHWTAMSSCWLGEEQAKYVRRLNQAKLRLAGASLCMHCLYV